jgi:hypothetical protein
MGGCQQPILATSQAKPSQPKLACNGLEPTMNPGTQGQKGSWFLRMSEKFHWNERVCTAKKN